MLSVGDFVCDLPFQESLIPLSRTINCCCNSSPFFHFEIILFVICAKIKDFVLIYWLTRILCSTCLVGG